jgi:hypothetical protein
MSTDPAGTRLRHIRVDEAPVAVQLRTGGRSAAAVSAQLTMGRGPR